MFRVIACIVGQNVYCYCHYHREYLSDLLISIEKPIILCEIFLKILRSLILYLQFSSTFHTAFKLC